jgi:hypothetical protein
MNADPTAKKTEKENYEEERAKFERVKIQMELEKVRSTACSFYLSTCTHFESFILRMMCPEHAILCMWCVHVRFFVRKYTCMHADDGKGDA